MKFKSQKQRRYVMSQMSKSKSSKLNMKHRKVTPEQKFNIVMSEYKRGNLHSSNGQIVTDKRQAVAIGYSEARKIDANYGKSSLTPFEKIAIKNSIEEEQQAQKDYKIRQGYSKSPKVKKTFSHIRKEEHKHEKEFEHLL